MGAVAQEKWFVWNWIVWCGFAFSFICGIRWANSPWMRSEIAKGFSFLSVFLLFLINIASIEIVLLLVFNSSCSSLKQKLNSSFLWMVFFVCLGAIWLHHWIFLQVKINNIEFSLKISTKIAQKVVRMPKNDHLFYRKKIFCSPIKAMKICAVKAWFVATKLNDATSFSLFLVRNRCFDDWRQRCIL